jgi:hypothetical protein
VFAVPEKAIGQFAVKMQGERFAGQISQKKYFMIPELFRIFDKSEKIPEEYIVADTVGLYNQ